MKLEKFKEKKKINKVVIVVLILLLITGGFILGTTYSKYRYETDKIPFINGKVKYTSGFGSGDVNFAFYIDGKEETTMPVKGTGYMYDAKTSKCDKEATIEWDNIEWGPDIRNLTQTKTSCELHFNKRNSFGEEIILADQPDAMSIADAKAKIKEKSKPEGTPDFTQAATEDEGLYMAEDDLGESYYFRGNVPDNWVYFANLYWRIIRVNGDGTVRMIYNGPTTNQIGNDTQISSQKFNNNRNNPMYVGYMYGTYDTDPTNPTKKIYNNTTNSAIKDYLENEWFDGALGSYTDYLADEIFCNDRTITSGNGSSGNNNYGPYKRINTDKNPSLQCPDVNDRFAVETKVGNVATNGQIAEGKPVGLITADEVSMAGGVYNTTNRSYYLCTNSSYWTMSPALYNSSNGYASEWFVYSPGGLDYSKSSSLYDYVDSTIGVRAVINIKSNVSVSGGNGTTGQPYTLQLN